MLWLCCCPIFQPDCVFIGKSTFPQIEQTREYLTTQPVSIVAVDGGYNHCYELDLTPIAIVGDLDSVHPDYLNSAQDAAIEIKRLPRAKDQTDLEYALDVFHKAQSLILGGLGDRLDHSFYNLYLLMQHPSQLLMETPFETVIALDRDYTIPACPDYKVLLLSTYKNPRVKNCETTLNLPTEISLDKPLHLSIDHGTVLAVFLPLSQDISFTRKILEKDFSAFSGHSILLDAGQAQHFESQPGQTISLIPFLGPATARTKGLKWELTGDYRHLNQNFMSLSNVALSNQVSIHVTSGQVLCIFNSIIDTEMLSLEDSSSTAVLTTH